MAYKSRSAKQWQGIVQVLAARFSIPDEAINAYPAGSDYTDDQRNRWLDHHVGLVNERLKEEGRKEVQREDEHDGFDNIPSHKLNRTDFIILTGSLAKALRMGSSELYSFPRKGSEHEVEVWESEVLQPALLKIEKKAVWEHKKLQAVQVRHVEQPTDDMSIISAISDPNYSGLYQILLQAFMQAARGKGYERHNLGGQLPFEKQRMQQICELLNTPDGMTYQVVKKLTEGLAHPTLEMKVKELRGAINYIAGIIVFLQARDPQLKVND